MDQAIRATNDQNPPKKNQAIRTTISLSADAVEKLDWLAGLQGISRNDAIRRAIATESYIREALQNGSKILIQKSDKSIQELVFVS